MSNLTNLQIDTILYIKFSDVNYLNSIDGYLLLNIYIYINL